MRLFHQAEASIPFEFTVRYARSLSSPTLPCFLVDARNMFGVPSLTGGGYETQGKGAKAGINKCPLKSNAKVCNLSPDLSLLRLGTGFGVPTA